MSDAAMLRQRLLGLYEELPAQLRAAAHWIIEHSNEVALLSMRDQAKRAGVPPSTMTRLAQRLGFDGYDDLRALYAARLLGTQSGLTQKATELKERRKHGGEDALSSDLIGTAASRITKLGQGQGPARLAEAARLIIGARRSFVIGQRAGFSVAYQLAYICSLAGCNMRLLDQPGGIGMDLLRDAGSADVMVAISVHPYTRATVDALSYANQRRMKIIAITDSEVSPLARAADVVVIAGVESPSFFNTMGAAFVAAEAIAALVAAGMGDRMGETLANSEAQFAALDTYILPRAIHSAAARRQHPCPASAAKQEPAESSDHLHRTINGSC